MLPQSNSGAAMQNALDTIRRKFIDGLGDRCLAVDAALQDIGKNGVSGVVCDLIIHHAHKTAGIAASLGFAELGELARTVEEEWGAQPSSATELQKARAATDRFLDEIERILDEDLAS